MRYDEYDRVALTRAVDDLWEIDGLRLLKALISIPAQSPGFDPQWERTGDLRRAVELVRQWAASRAVNGLEAQVVDGPGLRALHLLEIPEDWDAVCRADPSLARQWQLVVRRALEALFARGYTAVDCTAGRDGGRPRPLYVLQKGPLEA